MLNLIISILSGLALNIAFPNIELHWFIWIGIIPIFFVLNNSNLLSGFFLGFVYSFVHYFFLIFWVTYTFTIYGNLSWIVAIGILSFLCFALAIFNAIAFFLTSWICRKPYVFLYCTPVFWVTFDYLKSFMFTGLPWEYLAYSQYTNLKLIQIADIFGIYGVTFLIVLVNCFIYLFIIFLLKKDWKGSKIKKEFLIYNFVFIIIIFVCVFFYGNIKISTINIVKNESKHVTASIVQGNINQKDKWKENFQKSTVDKYLDLSLSLINKRAKPDIIVWSETALPFYFLYENKYTPTVIDGIKKINTDFLVGSPSYSHIKDEIKYYNTAFLIDSKGNNRGKYNKVHLVPFGEYVPDFWKNFFPFLHKIVKGTLGDFSPGQPIALDWSKCKLGIQICFELIYPELYRALVKDDAELLISMSNDAWFGTSKAAYQHFSMVIFRAIENRRAIIRSGNTGISGFIDPTGKIIKQTQVGVEAVETETVPIITLKSFYTQYGDVFSIVCVIITFFAVIITIFQVFYLKRNSK